MNMLLSNCCAAEHACNMADFTNVQVWHKAKLALKLHDKHNPRTTSKSHDYVAGGGMI